MNVQNIYLNSELNKIIYMKVPEEVEHLPSQNLICKLLKSIYELKQSVNLWNKKIIKMLRSIEFKLILADVSIFIHSWDIIMILYVDDMLILAKDLRKIEQVKNQIKKTHIMKNLRAINKILEIHMTHQKDSIKINQAHYIQ